MPTPERKLETSKPYFPTEVPVILPRYPTEGELITTAKILAAQDSSKTKRHANHRHPRQS